MFKDLVVSYLDPYFVREEELAAIISAKSNGEIAYRKWIRIPMGVINEGYAEAQVPAGYQWFITNVVGIDPGWGGAGALPYSNCLEISDENDQTMLRIGAEDMPALNAVSYISWGVDLADAIHDSGQLPPGYWISAPLPKILLRE
jgi:hypothetical protein